MKRPRVKITLEDVQHLAASRGGLCLSSVYQRDNEPLQWQCSEGHRWQTTYSVVRDGSWCPECFHIRRRGTLEAMQALAASRGGRCLSTRYIDAKTDLEWECTLGHRWHTTPDAVKNSHAWCPQCVRQRQFTHTIKEMQELARAHGGRCLSRKYVNSITSLLWCCAKGHRWKASPISVLGGKWCRQCTHDTMRHGLGVMQELAESRGGRCLSTHYTNVQTHLEWECSRGHTWRAIPSVILRGSWCPQCAILNRTLDRKKRKKYLDSNEKV